MTDQAWDAPMTTGVARVWARPARMPAGLPSTRANSVLLALLVLSLFAQRYELLWYGTGRVPLPSVMFTAVALLFTAKVYADFCLRSLRLRALWAVDAFVVLFGAVALLSIVAIVADPGAHANGVAQAGKTLLHLSTLGFIAILLGLVLTPASIVHIARVYVTAAAAAAAIGLVQFVDLNFLNLGAIQALGLYSKAVEGAIRVSSVFSEPAYFAFAMVNAMVIATFLYATGRRRRYLVAAALCASGVVVSLSAGGWIAMTMSLLLLMRGSHVRRLGLTWLVSFALVALLLSVLLDVSLLAPIAQRFSDKGSLPARLDTMQASAQIWQAHPVFGVGIGNTRFELPDLLESRFLLKEGTQFTAIAYLTVLAETGVVGLVALALLLAALLRRAADMRFAGIDLGSLSLALLLLALVERFWINNFLQPDLWVLFGIRIAVLKAGAEGPPRRADARIDAPLAMTRPIRRDR